MTAKESAILDILQSEINFIPFERMIIESNEETIETYEQ